MGIVFGLANGDEFSGLDDEAFNAGIEPIGCWRVKASSLQHFKEDAFGVGAGTELVFFPGGFILHEPGEAQFVHDGAAARHFYLATDDHRFSELFYEIGFESRNGSPYEIKYSENDISGPESPISIVDSEHGHGN